MKRAFILPLLILLTLACSTTQEADQPEDQATASTSETQPEQTEETSADNDTNTGEVDEVKKEEEPQSIFGYYVGMFRADEYKEYKKPSYANKINISIDKMTADSMFGHSVVAGNSRPFGGTYEDLGNEIKAEVHEPGDDRYDGVFMFTLDQRQRKITGYWESYNKNLAVTKRRYTLEQKRFVYNPGNVLSENVGWGVGLYDTYDEDSGAEEMLTDEVSSLNASVTRLKKEDVENMYKADLEVIRNAIYARHGYSFKNRRMRYLFDQYVDWYIPVKTNITEELTELELANIDLLKRYEGHAEKYYDSYGR